jgi:hypothetical protein
MNEQHGLRHRKRTKYMDENTPKWTSKDTEKESLHHILIADWTAFIWNSVQKNMLTGSYA